jgi:hypothetical protein
MLIGSHRDAGRPTKSTHRLQRGSNTGQTVE